MAIGGQVLAHFRAHAAKLKFNLELLQKAADGLKGSDLIKNRLSQRSIVDELERMKKAGADKFFMETLSKRKGSKVYELLRKPLDKSIESN